jgi:predicted transcriptional regulator
MPRALDPFVVKRHTRDMSRHTRRPSGLKTLSVKVPQALSARVVKLARSRSSTVSAVVREAIEQYAPEEGTSFAEAARDFIGCLDSGPGDLSTNQKHLKGFGR